jgi:hypothetical protein
LKTTSNPQAIETALNVSGNTINNLDLDGDGNIDYLKVNETATGMEVVDEVSASNRVTVSNLTINQTGGYYAIQGNPNYAGSTAYYESQHGLTFGDYLFFAYLTRPNHVIYHPRWGYHSGYYGNYRPYHTHYRTPYNSAAVTRARTARVSTPAAAPQPRQTTTAQAKVVVPQQRTSIADPSKSQRKPEVNNNNIGKDMPNAFSNKPAASAAPTPRAAAPVQRAATPARTSYAGGKSSFGGGSRSGSSGRRK